MQAQFEKLLGSTDGLEAALVTDIDGVTLIKAQSPDLPPKVLDAALSATFSVAKDQAGKIGLGPTQMILSIFDEYQIVQFNYEPLILSLIAPSSSNSGLLLDIGTQLKPQVQALASVVSRTSNEIGVTM